MLRADRELLASMLEAGQWSGTLARGMTLATLAANESIQDEVERALMVVSVKAELLSAAFKQAHADWPWETLARMQSLLVSNKGVGHSETVWRIVQEHVPSLLARIESALADDSSMNHTELA